MRIIAMINGDLTQGDNQNESFAQFGYFYAG